MWTELSMSPGQTPKYVPIYMRCQNFTAIQEMVNNTKIITGKDIEQDLNEGNGSPVNNKPKRKKSLNRPRLTTGPAGYSQMKSLLINKTADISRMHIKPVALYLRGIIGRYLIHFDRLLYSSRSHKYIVVLWVFVVCVQHSIFLRSEIIR